MVAQLGPGAVSADGTVGAGGVCLHPASLSQEALWFLDQTLPEPAIQNVPFQIRLEGPLRRPALASSLAQMVERYEVLRTRFRWVGTELQQEVLAQAAPDIAELDLRALAGDAQEQALAAAALGFALHRFDLAEGPLLRLLVVSLAPESHVLVLVVHHIVFDGWSLHLFMEAWRTLYRDLCLGQAPSLVPLASQFGAHARSQRLRLPDLGSQADYWRQHLTGAPGLLELPTDRPRPLVQAYESGRLTWTLTKDQTTALKALAQGCRATLFIALLTGLQVLLSRLSGQEDVVVGTAIAGRPSHAAWDQVGLFMNTLALRADLSGDPTLREAVLRGRQAALNGYANQELPFEHVVKLLNPPRNAGHAPVFQVLFVMPSGARNPGTFLDLEERWESVAVGMSMFDLAFNVVDTGDGISGHLDYAKSLFDRASAERLLLQYQHLLEAMVENPDQRLSELVLNSADQLRQPEASVGAEHPLPFEGLHEKFLRQVVLRPEATAVTFRGGSLSYGALEQLSGQVAAGLQARGIGPGVPVGVLFETCLEQVVAVLGVLRAGGMYVPLDPRQPIERLRFALADTAMAWVLSDRESVDALPAGSVKALCLDLGALAAAGRAHPVAVSVAEAPACVLYTSGSTGHPKGVVVRHRGMVNILEFMEDLLAMGPGKRVLGLTPISFDISGLERFMPLRTGGQVDLVDRPTAGNPEALADLIRRLDPDILQATPATWQLLSQVKWRGNPGMKILCGGEAINAQVAEYLLAQAGAVWNVYGPTETTIWSTFHRITPADLPEVPIGRPVWNTRVLLLDGRLQPVAPGVAGEICLAGAGLAEGYLHLDEQNHARFPEDPNCPGERIYRTGDRGRWRADGTLAYLGRIDNQVKIRGYRIELEEIEVVLSRHPAVIQAVVDVREGPLGPRLVAFMVTRPSAIVSRMSMQAFLKDHLAAYMVPDQFFRKDHLPLRNGKVDRAAIHRIAIDLEIGAATYEPPRSPTECLLAQIWEELLQTEKVGILDDFYDRGGHSLLVVGLVDRIEQVFGRRLPLASLFSGMTVESLALSLLAEGPHAADLPWIQVHEGAGDTLFFFHGDLGGGGLYCRPLAGHLGDRSLVAIHPHGTVGQAPAVSIAAMAADHLDLIRRLQPQGPYLLGGFCNGALEALELAAQLVDQGETVQGVVLVAPPGPRAEGEPELVVRPETLAEMALAPAPMREAMSAIYTAVAQHIWRPYAGPLAMILPECDVAAVGNWKNLLPQLRLFAVPGSHITCLASNSLGPSLRSGLDAMVAGSPR
jgi:amino acid adenylation domain-containing protein